jgi:hypothetical protein
MSQILTFEEYRSRKILEKEIFMEFVQTGRLNEDWKWYNTLFDWLALIPGVGSFFEGINAVSYATQGEYLLAGLCLIGLIPVFGQYIGVTGSLIFKAGGRFGKFIEPLIALVGRYLPKITEFVNVAAKSEKLKGIAPFVGKILEALKNFAAGKSPELVKEFKRVKTLTKLTKAGSSLLFGEKEPEIDMDKQKQLEKISDEAGSFVPFLKSVE